MGSRFLIGGNGDLEALQDGTFDASLNSLTIPSKTLNLPAVFDSGLLTERLLTPDDMNFTVVSNPYRSALSVIDLETLTTFSLNVEIQKIDNFQASSEGNTNISGTVHTDIIKVSEIYDQSDSSSLQFSNTSIGVLASNFNLNDNNITNVNDISANRFIVRGGTDIEYLMGDGSTLTQSANSGNSNFYLYTSINTSNAPPIASGNVEYDNVNQSLATFVYISHLTRDNIDIEIFFQNVSTLNILYLQDQNDSNNYIRYDITGNATIVANSYISVPVLKIDSAGTGSTSFGASHNILVSIFTNTQETNTRLSAVETKTQNQTAVSNLTTFSGTINSLDILPATTNTNNVGSSTFPFLSSEATTANTKTLTIWNSARTFNHSITSLATTANVPMSLPATQSFGLLQNNGFGTLYWSNVLSPMNVITSGAITGGSFITNGLISPAVDNTNDIGTTGKHFKDIYMSGSLYNSLNQNLLTKNYGSLWFNGNSANTTIVTAGTYVSIVPTSGYTTAFLAGFTTLSGILTYTGVPTKTFMVSYNGYLSVGTAGMRPIVSITTGRGFSSMLCPTAGARYNFSGQNIVQLAQNATVEIVISSDLGTGTINVFTLFFNVIQID